MQGQVISGWDNGVVGMKVGGRRQLTIPPDMGYGSRGAGGVVLPVERMRADDGVSREEGELYRKACDGQEAGGCFNLGVTYATGIGVRQSDDEARKFLGKACDLKSESGCTQYARLKTEKK